MFNLKYQKMKKFNNINTIVNANAIEMKDGSKWILWGYERIKEGVPTRNLEKIARLITE